MNYSLIKRLFVYFLALFFFSQIGYAKQSPKIARALFTSEIVDREPTDQILILRNTNKKVFFFSELRHFDGQTISHKWMYDGKVNSVVKFNVKGPRWRVYSRIDILPEQLGKWSVVVQDQTGRAIKASVFRLVDSEARQIILPLTE